jgi:alkylated DNA repair dioxygenase AlkB
MNGLAVFCRATYRKKTLLAGIAGWSAPARRTIFSMRKSNEHSKSHVEGNTIPGLRIIPNYLTDQEHEALLKELRHVLDSSKIKSNPNYNRKIVNLYKHAITQYGNIAQSVKKPLQDKLISDEPDTLQVNQYTTEGGTPMHKDAKSVGDVISMYSFLSKAVMTLSKKSDDGLSTDVVKVLLEPKSLLILENDARHKWDHGIEVGKEHKFGDKTIEKGERISLVFWKTSDPSVTMKNFKSTMSDHLNLHNTSKIKRRGISAMTPPVQQEPEKQQEQDPNFVYRFNAFDNINSLDNINMSEEQRLQIEKEVEEHMKQMNLKKEDDKNSAEDNSSKREK